MSVSHWHHFGVSPSCDLKQTVFISLFTGSQPYLGELSFCQHPLSGCSLAKGTSAKEKGISQPRGDSWEGLSATDSAYEQTWLGPDQDLIPLLSPIHSCWASFPDCTNCSSGSSLCQRRICEIPALQAWLWDVLAVHSLLGSCSRAALAGVLSSWLGWAGLLLPSTPGSLFSLGAELLWSSLGWRIPLSRSVLELSPFVQGRLQLLCATVCVFAMSLWGAQAALVCHWSVWRKGQSPYPRFQWQPNLCFSACTVVPSSQ